MVLESHAREADGFLCKCCTGNAWFSRLHPLVPVGAFPRVKRSCKGDCYKNPGRNKRWKSPSLLQSWSGSDENETFPFLKSKLPGPNHTLGILPSLVLCKWLDLELGHRIGNRGRQNGGKTGQEDGGDSQKSLWSSKTIWAPLWSPDLPSHVALAATVIKKTKHTHRSL